MFTGVYGVFVFYACKHYRETLYVGKCNISYREKAAMLQVNPIIFVGNTGKHYRETLYIGKYNIFYREKAASMGFLCDSYCFFP